MILSTVPALSKRVIHSSIRLTKRLVRLLRPQGNRLLFAYGGRTNHWPGMGRALYEHEPVFRTSVQETCRLIVELSGQDILPNFDGPLDPDFFASGTKTMFSIITLQLALTDLWKAKGIVPDATMGVSLGEIVAVYAAGGLTRLDAVRICTAWFVASMKEPQTSLPIHLSTSLENAQALCRRCPVALTVVYQVGPNSVVLFGTETEKASIITFLEDNGLCWEIPRSEKLRPYHTPIYTQYYELVQSYLREVHPQPIAFTYYSATIGNIVPKGSLVPNRLWTDLICSPVLLYTLLQRVAVDDFQFITHVGPHPFLTGNTQKKSFSALSTYTILDSMRHYTPELKLFQHTCRTLWQATWPKILFSRLNRQTNEDEYSRFLQKLNLSAPEVVASAPEVYDYLRSQRAVHYLPVYKGWLVSDYADVNYVLQHPELFSSEINQGFDAYLVGIDPPDHATIRALIMPLFAPQVLANLSDFTRQELTNRLLSLASRDQFDVVEELTIPLTQTIIAYFLDLSPSVDQDLRASLKAHLYSLTYMDNLKSFFQTYLEQPLPGRIGQLLLNYVQAGQLPFEGAVSLMRTLWIAGTLTTSILLTNLINTLVRQPQLAERLRINNDLIPKFVEEGLRLEPSETTLWRTTTQATTLKDQQLPAGTLVMLSLFGANRDPRIFVNPNDYVLDRPARRVMTFGGGVHQCIGAGIARSQAQIVVKAVLTALPNLRLAQPGPLQYYNPTSQRAIINLWACAS